MTSVIETRGLRKRYRKVEALSGLDLEVPEGTICGFLGPNGAGKTTTMKIIMGLIRPTDGWASVLGKDLDGNGLGTRSRIGYLPQDPSFFPKAKVPAVLRFAAQRYRDGSRSAIDARVEETIELVGLSDRIDRRVKALSGGELRRLGIGQAVIGNPDLLILDEPSVGLDPEGRRQVLDLLESLKGQMTIFYSSHILDDVERIADHVIVVDHGSVVEQGPMNRFLGGSSATYAISLDGDGASIVDHLGEQPWVTGTRPIGGNGWEIETVDRLSAEHRLLRALTENNGTRVTEFRPVRRNLEDIYLDLVEVGDGD
jgi:ABC-2 type transport system ATP-binding protein